MNTQLDTRRSCEQLLDDLHRQRDELKVKIRLAEMEVRDEWEAVEHKWEHLQARKQHLVKELNGSCKDIGNAVDHLVKELQADYKKLHKLL